MPSDFVQALLFVAVEQFPALSTLSEQLDALMTDHVRVHASGDRSFVKGELKLPAVQKVLEDNGSFLAEIFCTYASHVKHKRQSIVAGHMEEYQFVNFLRVSVSNLT